MREQFIEVPSQTTITKDNAPINVDFLIYWRIVDPLQSVVNVANFAGALQGVATTTLRAVIGDILLDDVLSKREQINEVLRVKLDEVTERWGGKVTTVEIREITPPRDVQDAMNRQLSAERTRRAVVTESEGARQSAINVAEGQKQSEILKAEGDRQAAILRAEGFSQALDADLRRRAAVDEKTMALQYLEALKALGASPSTKFVIPTEFTRFAEPVGGYVSDGLASGSRRRDGPRPLAAGGRRHAGGGTPAVIRRARRGRGAGRRRRRDPAGDRRMARRLMAAPRTGPDEAGLRPAVDALGGEVVRLRSRDGVRLAGRWLPAEPGRGRRLDARPARGDARCSTAGPARSRRTSSSSRRTCAGRRACSGSTSAATAARTTRPTTFGLREVEDVAGALAWLGERGHPARGARGLVDGRRRRRSRRSSSLGDGRLAAADADPDAPAAAVEAPRPRIVGARRGVGRAGAPDPVASRMRMPFGPPRSPAGRSDAHRADGRRRPARDAAGADRAAARGRAAAADPRRRRRDRPAARTRGAWRRSRRTGAAELVVTGADHGRGHAVDPAALRGGRDGSPPLGVRDDPIVAGTRRTATLYC